MTDERALRDDVEWLGAALRDAKQRVADAEARAAERTHADTLRVGALKAQREALLAQLEVLQSSRVSQLEQLRVLTQTVADTRDSVPSHASTSMEGPDAVSWIVRFLTDPTPAWARRQSWVGKLVARWLRATGNTWK